jgi:hypothetical protein
VLKAALAGTSKQLQVEMSADPTGSGSKILCTAAVQHGSGSAGASSSSGACYERVYSSGASYGGSGLKASSARAEAASCNS